MTAGDALALDAEARKRFASAWAGGPPAELDAAIAPWQDAVRLMPPGTPHRCAVSNNLGVALLDRWERDADPDALDAAIDAGEQAIGGAAANTPAGASARVQLSKALRARRLREDIERAIELLEHTPGAAHSLGNALYHRYELTRRRVDLDAAIAQLRNADGDPRDAPARQNDLASALIARLEADGDRADLDEAIELLAALVATDDTSSFLLTNLGNAFRLRAVDDGAPAELEAAIRWLERAVELDPREPGMLSNLASALLERFDMTGLIPDVDAAIDVLATALELSPPGSSGRASRLNNLGIALRDRQLRRRTGREDLDRAVAAFEEALAATPDSGLEAAALHGNLANVLHQRAAPGDLDRAVGELEAALAATPDGSPDRPMYLNSLAASLAARGQHPDRAVALAAEAVRLCSAGSAQRAKFLVNLANNASERGRFEDLATARDAYREAIEAGMIASPATALAAARSWSEWARARGAWAEVAEAHERGQASLRALFETQVLRADKESWLHDAQGLTADGAFALAQSRRAKRRWRSRRAGPCSSPSSSSATRST